MAASLDVSLEFQSVVVPCLPTPDSTLYLHNIDQQVFFHVDMLFFYDKSDEDVVETLHASLAKALVPYHFAAGRYRVNEEEGRRLEIVCNRSGALFAAASSTKSLAELEELSAPNPEFRKLLLFHPNVETIDQIPLLTVQVTKFACGGTVVGFSASHTLFDGVELYNFYTNYSKISRGDDRLHLTLKPNMDKTYLRPEYIDKSNSPPHPELVSLPDSPAKLLFKPADYSLNCNPVPPGYFFKTFSFTPKMLLSLKERVLSEGLVSRCSTFEALAAHVWQCKTKAFEQEDEAAQASKLFVVIDIRSRLQASLPEGHAGNAVVAAPCFGTSSKEVCESSLSFCVEKVQETIRKTDESYIRAHVGWCQGKNGVINLSGGMLVTAWSKLGIDSVDFGFGKPRYVAPVVNGRVEYVTFLSNCVGDGGIDVFMAMEFEKMNNLEKLLFDH